MARPLLRRRTAARVAAVQALYQSDQTGDAADQVIDQFLRHRLGAEAAEGGYEEGRVPEAESALFTQIVRAASLGQAERDAMLAGALPADWPVERLDPVLRCLLRAGIAELAMPDGPPARVVINEYLDVAHGFFWGEEPGLANAVLDRLARTLRPAEFPATAGG
jgi:transcription antitermination protein NusB